MCVIYRVSPQNKKKNTLHGCETNNKLFLELLLKSSLLYQNEYFKQLSFNGKYLFRRKLHKAFYEMQWLKEEQMFWAKATTKNLPCFGPEN